MSDIRPIDAIAEPQPVRPVAQRLPGPQADDHHQPGHSNEQEEPDNQEANPAAFLAQQAYQQQTHQTPSATPALLAQDLMTSPVISLPSGSTLLEAWAMMKRKGIHHLPVTAADGTLAGLVSDRELLPYAHELESSDSPGPSARHTVAQVMSIRPLFGTPTTELRAIARIMLDECVSAVPILDNAHHPIGILTTTDILRAIVHRSPIELWT